MPRCMLWLDLELQLFATPPMQFQILQKIVGVSYLFAYNLLVVVNLNKPVDVGNEIPAAVDQVLRYPGD